MPPSLLLALGALQLARQAIPVVQDLFKKGLITAAQQQKVLDEYNSLKDSVEGDAFTGPGWKIEPDPS